MELLSCISESEHTKINRPPDLHYTFFSHVREITVMKTPNMLIKVQKKHIFTHVQYVKRGK